MLETIHGILNELTPSQFHELLERIHALNFCTEDQLSGMITLFFEKVYITQFLNHHCSLSKFLSRLLVFQYFHRYVLKRVKLC